MRTKFVLYAAVAVLSLSLIPATQVRADSTDSFVYQIGGNTFTWELPSQPLVAPGNAAPGSYFTLTDVSVSENGAPATLGIMDFFSVDYGGGLDFYVGDYYYIDAFGPLLYSGSETSPTFLTGTFTDLTDYGNGDIDGPPIGIGTLQISSTAVPEPSTLLLLMLGLAAGLVLLSVRGLSPFRSVI